MRYIKVTFSDGNYLHTGINGTDEEIKRYYIGNLFTVSGKRVKAVAVEFQE